MFNTDALCPKQCHLSSRFNTEWLIASLTMPPVLNAELMWWLQRLVNVPAEIGYGDKGIGEIPPGATVQLLVELLKIVKWVGQGYMVGTNSLCTLSRCARREYTDKRTSSYQQMTGRHVTRTDIWYCFEYCSWSIIVAKLCLHMLLVQRALLQAAPPSGCSIKTIAWKCHNSLPHLNRSRSLIAHGP